MAWDEGGKEEEEEEQRRDDETAISPVVDLFLERERREREKKRSYAWDARKDIQTRTPSGPLPAGPLPSCIYASRNISAPFCEEQRQQQRRRPSHWKWQAGNIALLCWSRVIRVTSLGTWPSGDASRSTLSFSRYPAGHSLWPPIELEREPGRSSRHVSRVCRERSRPRRSIHDGQGSNLFLLLLLLLFIRPGHESTRVATAADMKHKKEKKEKKKKSRTILASVQQRPRHHQSGSSTGETEADQQAALMQSAYRWEKLSPAEFEQLQDLAACKYISRSSSRRRAREKEKKNEARPAESKGWQGNNNHLAAMTS